MSRDPLPTDAFRRGTSVFALVAGVATHELRHRLHLGGNELRTRIAQAKLMAESLGRLKGALMKAGQLLSIDASDFLPPEAMEVLASLQGHAEPVDFEVIRGVLVEQLGEDGLRRLVDLDPIPAASASIGQVHRAQVGGPVAVKVQYPGVADSIDSDIALLEKFGGSLLAISRRKIDMEGLFDELRSILHFEADYVRERTFLDKFAALLAGDPRFVVPKSVPALCTSRVLTMSWEDGMPLGEWMKTERPREDRTALVKSMLDLYCREFFEWGVVQTDPNFGNFLMRDDGRIVLLDFGASVEYDDTFRAQYVALLRTVAAGDRAGIIEHGIAMELINPREPTASKELFADMLASSVEPFDDAKQPFAFRDSDYAARSRDVSARFVKSLVYSPPPRRLIFLHRKLGGLFQLAKRLDVELDLAPYWKRMVA